MTQQHRQESDAEARPDTNYILSRDVQGEAHPAQAPQNHDAGGELSVFHLTLSASREEGEQSDDEDYTSQISSDSALSTPLASPVLSLEEEQQRTTHLAPDGTSYLDTDRNSVSISHHSSVDVGISFHDEDEPEVMYAVGPDDETARPWTVFLDDEITSTHSTEERYTHRMLLLLREYFGIPLPTREYARLVAETLASVNDDYLTCASSWEVFEHDADLQGFIWLVWGALVEVVVRMDYRGDDADAAVLLVGQLLRTEPRKGREIIGKNGRTWQGAEVPSFRDIWPSAYVGFAPGLRGSRTLEAAPEEWIALLSFLGRLTAAGLTDSWELEVWALDDCLSETTWEKRAPGGISECLVLAAAEFVTHAGESMAVAGAQSKGWARSMSLAKWNHWMLRFAEVAEVYVDGPGPVQWAAWYAREHMLEVGEQAGFPSSAYGEGP